MKSLIFKDWGIRAMLAGKKTMTRRLMNIPIWWEGHFNYSKDCAQLISRDGGKLLYPKIRPGDLFYAKEAWQDTYQLGDYPGEIVYRSTYIDDYRGLAPEGWIVNWKSPLHLREQHARIFRRITSIKAEKLQNISEVDALQEGVEFYCDLNGITYREAFKRCTIDIHGPKIWEENPWVWVYEFEEMEE